jgi:hypothetical protein
MKKLLNLITAGVFGTAIVMACTNGNNSNAENAEASAVVNQQDNQVNVSDWPETAKKAANAMMEKYGQPNEHTVHMLVWLNTGPFDRTIVFKEEVQHDFPMPHKDVLEQFVNYQVPADKFDELAMFDGSVMVDRTKGKLSARCDKEGANILALNLSDDVITGKRTVDQARQFYGEAMMKMMQGEKVAQIESLQFDASKANTGFTDRTTMDMSKVKQMK